MSDLISRQAAIDAIKAEWEEPLHSGETWEIIERSCDRIYNLPSAEPKKGKWKKVTDGPWYWFECSECGRKPLWMEWGTERCFSPFCPHCGAKMEVSE